MQNLKLRAYQFSLDVIRSLKNFSKNQVTYVLVNQLIRSSTSLEQILLKRKLLLLEENSRIFLITLLNLLTRQNIGFAYCAIQI